MELIYKDVSKKNLSLLLFSCYPRITGGSTIEEDGKLVSYSTNALGYVVSKHWKQENGLYTIIMNPDETEEYLSRL